MDYLGRSHFDLAASAAEKKPATAETLALALQELAKGFRDMEIQAQEMQRDLEKVKKALRIPEP